MLPWNNGHPGKDPAIRAVNAGIAALASSEEIELFDFHATLDGYRRLGERAFRPF